MFESYVAFDFETTGLDAQRDRIIQIGAVRVERGAVAERWHSLVNPGVPVPRHIQRLTGITPDMLAGSPRLEEVLPGLLDFLGAGPLVAHNAPFDAAFLAAACRSSGNPVPAAPVYDSLALARLALPTLASHRLDHLAKHLGIRLAAAHNALADAEATGLLFGRLLEELLTYGLDALQAAARFAEGEPWGLGAVLAWAVGRRAWGPQPSAAGAEEPPEPRQAGSPGHRGPAAVPYDPARVVSWLGAAGPVAARLGRYEHREGQLAMAQAVAGALPGGSFLLVEAGTGTGKSLAYLVPAAAWAAASGEKVVVSTHTVHLQEQLLKRDIPLLQEALPVPFRAAIMKGRSHYVCLARWEEMLAQPQPPGQPERRLYARVATWLERTATGDRAELNLRQEEEAAWAAIAADETCPGMRCRLAPRCHFLRARAEAEKADLLVVNHALLLSDAASGHGVLPAYRYLVCDEAHHLPEVAAEHLGLTADQRALNRIVEGLEAGTAPAQGRGFLARARRAAAAAGASQGALEHGAAGIAAALTAAAEAAEAARRGIRDLFAALRAWAGTQPAPGGDQWTQCWRLPAGGQPTPAWEAVRAAWGNLAQRLQTAARSLERLGLLLAALPGGAGEEPAEEAALRAQRLAQAGAELEAMLSAADSGDPDHVLWLELDPGRDGEPAAGAARVRMSPLFPGPILAEALFRPLDACVLTSATLTVAGSFDFIAAGLGLEQLDRPVERLAVPSPFRYREQALLCIPADLPEPSATGDGAYVEAVASFLRRLLAAVGGGTLVLFTSHRLLREVYARLKRPLEEADIALLGQGLDGGRARLLEAFLAHPRAVLFGSASFWEGVDVPGAALRCVVMVRLPFRPPTSPLAAARLEALGRLGQDGFRQLTLPEAVIRFKQGFGRLIRTARDRGVVVILDQRLLTRRDAYGRAFLDSLPDPAVFTGSGAGVLEAVADWLAQGQGTGEGDAIACAAYE